MTFEFQKLVRNEDGFISMVNAVAVMLCGLLIVLVLNVGHVTHEKVDMQNAADSVAYTGALWQARGMNAVTATNHVMGEMLSLVIVHEAIGGKLLDAGGRAEDANSFISIALGGENQRARGSQLVNINVRLEAAANAARGLGARTVAFDTVRQRDGVRAEATMVDAKATLKQLLTRVYWAKVAAKIMQMSSIPPVVAAGVALEIAMDALELKIWQEYTTLNALHGIARGLVHFKRLLRDQMLPAAKLYTQEVVALTPLIAQQAARKVARLNDTQGTLFPVVPRLPLVIDPHAKAARPVVPDSMRVASFGDCGCPTYRTAASRDQVVKITQLARATFPWVNYNRKPILDVMGALLTLSKASHFYFDHTNGYSKRICDEVQTGRQNLGQFVLHDYPSPDKGYALWTEDADRADRLFTVVGLAFRDPPRVVGAPAVFKQQHPRGRLTYAQAILYNANAQVRPACKIDLTCKRIVPSRQADVGWDTLNWKSGTVPYELVGFGIPHEMPQVQVNWQAKLVPATTTRMGDVYTQSGTLPGPFPKLIEKMAPRLPAPLLTH